MSVSDKFSQLVNVVIIVIVCIHVPLTTLFEIDTVKKKNILYNFVKKERVIL